MKKKDFEAQANIYRMGGLTAPEKMGFEAMAEDYLARGVVIMELNDKLDECHRKLVQWRRRVIKMSAVLGVVSSMLIVQWLLYTLAQ
ncbi:MAG: hypothetical protein ABIA47_00950 [bacterium]